MRTEENSLTCEEFDFQEIYLFLAYDLMHFHYPVAFLFILTTKLQQTVVIYCISCSHFTGLGRTSTMYQETER